MENNKGFFRGSCVGAVYIVPNLSIHKAGLLAQLGPFLVEHNGCATTMACQDDFCQARFRWFLTDFCSLYYPRNLGF